MNIRTQDASFGLGKLLVHGSFITEVHIVAQTDTPRFFNISYNASKLNQNNWGWRAVSGSCARALRVVPFNLGPHSEKNCDELAVKMELSSILLTTPEWLVKVIGQPVYDRVAGPEHRLDITISPRLRPTAVHGIVGQSFGDVHPRQGRLDEYPPLDTEGVFTTSAMAEGAIDGEAREYEMSDVYGVSFKYSLFDDTSVSSTASSTASATASALPVAREN